jgi:CheY-like chemotaxis protein
VSAGGALSWLCSSCGRGGWDCCERCFSARAGAEGWEKGPVETCASDFTGTSTSAQPCPAAPGFAAVLVQPQAGALTLVAPDGNEAIRIVSEDPPELVVLDMMLPKRSGFLVLEKIKGRDDSPLVIMVTANEGKRHQAYAESLGVDLYLTKPLPLDRLIDAAVELLNAED